jgi:hypothetical protein
MEGVQDPPSPLQRVCRRITCANQPHLTLARNVSRHMDWQGLGSTTMLPCLCSRQTQYQTR